jgi:predicted AAA+ superfamily ATPase
MLILDNLKGSIFIINLLRLIAFQIGNEVSYSELGRALKAGNKTVQRYLDLLEKMYVLFSLNGFSRNMRKEYTKSPRYYFWDNGIRNAVISNFTT